MLLKTKRHCPDARSLPHEFIDAGDQILAVGQSHFRTKGSTERHSSRLCNLWTMREGKASRLEVFNDTALIWRALGGGSDYWNGA